MFWGRRREIAVCNSVCFRSSPLKKAARPTTADDDIDDGDDGDVVDGDVDFVVDVVDWMKE